MSYKKSCFIRKNTEELRSQLIKLGYYYGGKSSSHGNDDCLYSSKDVGRFFECSQKPARYDIIIDCGDNEELFLALAALRDDTNDYQWFIWQDFNDEGDPWRQYIPGEKWQEWWWFEVKKATPEEIIEHFKK